MFIFFYTDIHQRIIVLGIIVLQNCLRKLIFITCICTCIYIFSGKKATSIPDMKSKNVKSASDLEAQWQKEEDEKRQAAEQEEKKIEEAKKKEVEELRKIEEKKVVRS